ncbi:MAG: glycosyltransferase family 4 protein [Phycisphaerae bacterium]|jgi:glycosyltransferase involved in cell wall biosynthesis|nr:glycosyltransferase family 4 protein [Phycisphaerae bacterium]
MRIAMVGLRGLPARGGGAERVVECLADELALRGHEIIVYGRRDYLRDAPPWQGGRVVLTPGVGGKNLETFTHTATAVWDLMRRDVDVVHVHSPGPALWSWAAALRARAVVFTVHAADWRRDKWSLPAKMMLNLGLGIGMRVAREVTAVSQPLATELSERFGRDVTFIPNSVRAAEPVPPGEVLGDPRWSLSPDRYALFVGRIEPEKRLDVLLKAWEKVSADLEGYQLAVVGDFMSTSYGRECRKNAPDRTVFLGLQHAGRLAELYSNAAIVVQPSVLEGMSLVLLEAASYGRCILATEIQENVAVLGDCGIYFKGDDVDELSALICRYLRSERERSFVGGRARSAVAQKLSWTEIAIAMERMYHRALG